jgi:hypothetical protein
METLVLIREGRKFKVYRQVYSINGYSRKLIGTFKTSYDAERFMNKV